MVALQIIKTEILRFPLQSFRLWRSSFPRAGRRAGSTAIDGLTHAREQSRREECPPIYHAGLARTDTVGGIKRTTPLQGAPPSPRGISHTGIPHNDICSTVKENKESAGAVLYATITVFIESEPEMLARHRVQRGDCLT